MSLLIRIVRGSELGAITLRHPLLLDGYLVFVGSGRRQTRGLVTIEFASSTTGSFLA